MKIDKRHLSTAIYSNSYDFYIKQPEKRGFLSHRSRSLALTQSICDDFFANSKMRRGDSETEFSIASYLADPGLVMNSLQGLEDNSGQISIPLPDPAPLDLALGDAIIRRRSIRSFTGDHMTLSALSSLLFTASGITGEGMAQLSDGSNVSLSFRAAPSPGGLYPFDIFFAAINIKDLEPGIYRYQPYDNNLIVYRPADDMEEFYQCLSIPSGQINYHQANLIMLLTARPWKVKKKYGPRGLRMVFHEAGSISQNVHLTSVALGLASVDCASYYDDEIDQFLAFDGIYRSIIHSIIIGTRG